MKATNIIATLFTIASITFGSSLAFAGGNTVKGTEAYMENEMYLLLGNFLNENTPAAQEYTIRFYNAEGDLVRTATGDECFEAEIVVMQEESNLLMNDTSGSLYLVD